MPGDPHPRSAHRASPAGGLALLTPQALVRQAQAGRARARQAIVRQAQAGQARAREATVRQTEANQARARTHEAIVRQAQAGQARAREAIVRQAQAGQARAREAIVRQALARQTRLLPDRPAAPQHRQHRIRQSPAAGGRQRCAPQRRAPTEPQQALQTLMRGLAALIVLAVVGLSAFFVIAEERRGPGRDSAAPAGAEAGIASREVDAEPLTQQEVFPELTVRLAAGDAGYQVTLTHSDSACRTATSGELGPLLDDYGCDQVVRARLTAPYGGYLVTAGVFNLADEGGAAQVSDLTGTLVENGRGTFSTLGGSLGDPLTEPLAQVGWHSRGHYLLYCVIARPDGQLVADDDPYAARITADLVERYLGEQIIGQRTPGGVS
jgi:hypothetical protein